MRNSYKDIVVRKPWGYEYLVYESPDVALWLLHIEKNKATSLHCHPMKTTGLILLEGEAEIGFIADSKVIQAPSKQMIRRGLFHSTTALSENGVIVLEIETPNDKQDLIRLVDNYGRSKKGYETQNEWYSKTSAQIWIENPKQGMTSIYLLNNTEILVSHISTLSEVHQFLDDEIVMFLNGGIGKEVSGRKHLATVPGDIGIGSVIKKVATGMEYCSPETIVLRVGSSGRL